MRVSSEQSDVTSQRILQGGERDGDARVAHGVEHAQPAARAHVVLGEHGVAEEALAELRGARQHLLHVSVELEGGRVDAVLHGARQVRLHETDVLVSAVAALLRARCTLDD